jgi:hypothetical protein
VAVAQLGEGNVQVIGGDGQVVSTLTPPVTDYVGWPVFSPNGDLAFVSLTLLEGSETAPPRPNPGYISLVKPPYTGQPETLYSGNDVATLWEWLDDNRLTYGSMDDQGSVGTSLIGRDGQPVQLSPNYALGVLR